MSKPKILVIGASGFIGYPLVKRLRKSGHLVECFEGRIEHFDSVKTAIETILPNVIFHLAGISNVTECEKFPDRALQVNTSGAINLGLALQASKLECTLFFASTGQVYDTTLSSIETNFLNETWPLKPQNVYSTSKHLAEICLHEIQKNSKFRLAILRLFNHIHSSQQGNFFFPSIVEQLNSSKDGDTLLIGNIELVRDFSPVQSLLEILEHLVVANIRIPKYEIFNICSQTPRPLRELISGLELFLQKNIYLKEDANKIRPNDPKRIVGDNSKILNFLQIHRIDLTVSELIAKYFAPLD